MGIRPSIWQYDGDLGWPRPKELEVGLTFDIKEKCKEPLFIHGLKLRDLF